MYIRKTNHKIRPTRTPDEKEKIVVLYLNHEMGVRQIVREFDLCHNNMLYRWGRQYKNLVIALKLEAK